MSNYKFTKSGLLKTQKFIKECNAKRKEILDAKIDTADETLIPTEDDILCDIDFFIDSDGQYYNNWGVTDNYNSDTPLCLLVDKDFIKED